MLGRLKRKPWRWAAFGKHPVAADFLHIAPEDPVLAAFGTWVGSGFPGRDQCAERYSWRFFAPGASGELVCGLLVGSADRVGRPFPFSVIGTGPYKEWEKFWVLLPLALEDVWRRLEYIPGRSFPAVDALKTELANLWMPASQWRQWRTERNALNPGPSAATPWEKDNGLALYDLSTGSAEDRLACLLNTLEKIQGEWGKIPGAVFAGGGTENQLAVLFRPLRKSDFSRLCQPDFPH